MAHDVFISYAVGDKSVADALCASLERDGVRCWIAPRDVPPDADWDAAALEAIDEARVLVLVFSQFANPAVHMRREAERATDLGVALILYRIENLKPAAALDAFIAGAHEVDAFTPPVERHPQELVEAVKRSLSETPPPAPRLSAPAHAKPKPKAAAPRRLGPVAIAVVGIAALAGAAAYRLQPPSPFGEWSAIRMQWTPGAAARFAPVALGGLAGRALDAGQATSAFRLTPLGGFRRLTAIEDDGTVTRSGSDLVFTSKTGATAKVSLTAYAPGDAQVAGLGGRGGDAALSLNESGRPPEAWLGVRDLLAGGGPLDGVAGAWRSGAWPTPAAGPSWTGALTITTDGVYQLTLYAVETGTWTSAKGKWTLAPAGPGQPGPATVGGAYVFGNRNVLTLTSALGATSWSRQR
jgi:hypothetical protein